MSNLINNSSTVPLSANGVFKGQTVKVDQQFMTCTVSVNTDVSGTLTFNHSQDGFNFYTLGDSFAVNGQTHKEVILKGLYFYVKYTNDSVPQTLFNLFTKTSLNVRDQNASGGGAGGDVNITGCEVTLPVSLITGFATETTLGSIDTKLGAELKVNVISGFATETTQADLLLLAENQDLNGVKINPDHPFLTSYDFANNHVQMTMKGPTTQDFRWTIDTTNNREGWLFSNQNGDTDGGNCYWYSNGAGLGNQTPLQYQNFTSFYIVATINNTDSVNNAPFIGCYSPPTGTNDCIPSFAHSRWVFSLAGETQLFQYEKVLLYYGEIPKVHSNIRHIPLSLVSIGNNGDRNPSEIIYLITANTQSGISVGSINYLLQNAGFIASDVNREYEFNNSLERKQIQNLSAESIKVQVNNFPLPVSSISVNNFPASQTIDGTVAISNTGFNIDNFPATQTIDGTVAISNTGFNIDNFPASQTIDGTVAISNTGFNIDNFPAIQTIDGTVAFSNTVIDTHIYANSSGNNMNKVHCDNQGYLLTGIVDVSENRCTTSAVNGSRGLDVNVLNGTSTTPLYTRALTSSDVVSANVKSGSGTAITSTVVSTKTGLDVNVCNSLSSAPLYCTPGVDVGSNLNTGWNNSSLTSASVSTAIDIQWAKTVSVLCRAGGTGTLVIQVSVDNTNWYTTATTISLVGTADTVVNYNDLGARYIRLKSNSTVTGVYATIAGK